MGLEAPQIYDFRRLRCRWVVCGGSWGTKTGDRGSGKNSHASITASFHCIRWLWPAGSREPFKKDVKTKSQRLELGLEGASPRPYLVAAEASILVEPGLGQASLEIHGVEGRQQIEAIVEALDAVGSASAAHDLRIGCRHGV